MSLFNHAASDERMNSINSVSSADGSTSSPIFSIACDVLSPARVNKRKALCRASIVSAEIRGV